MTVEVTGRGCDSVVGRPGVEKFVFWVLTTPQEEGRRTEPIGR